MRAWHVDEEEEGGLAMGALLAIGITRHQQEADPQVCLQLDGPLA